MIDIFDTAGHDDFQRVRPISYNKADVIIICFSLVDKDSLTNACTKWYKEVRLFGPKCPIILVGTKLDLRDVFVKSTDKKIVQKCVTY
jgi:small GTP-binding protein